MRYLLFYRVLVASWFVYIILTSCSSFGQVNALPGPGNSGITGKIMSKSDVMSIPDQPMRATIIAIPIAKADSLFGHTETDQERVGGMHISSARFMKQSSEMLFTPRQARMKAEIIALNLVQAICK